jgi:hypothetical protein
MVPERDKPKRTSMRPMLRLFLVFGAVAILFANGGAWRIAGYILAGVLVLAAVLFRIFGRGMAHAREPDPESTLKL